MKRGRGKPLKIKTTGYGRSTYPKAHGKPPAGPACEKCRALTIGPRGKLSCGKGHALGTAATCPAYADASVERPVMEGGLTGRPIAW